MLMPRPRSSLSGDGTRRWRRFTAISRFSCVPRIPCSEPHLSVSGYFLVVEQSTFNRLKGPCSNNFHYFLRVNL